MAIGSKNTSEYSDHEDFAGDSLRLTTFDSLDTNQLHNQLLSDTDFVPETPIEERYILVGEGEGDDGDTLAEEALEQRCITPTRAKKKKKRWLTINTSSCKYESIRRVSRRFGMREVDDDDWIVYWCDSSVSLEKVMEMKRFQKINHFPGMIEICRKDMLARNISRMLKLFPKEYNFCPRSWCLPHDYGDFQNYVRSKKNKTYITKPENGCQGRGIVLTKNPLRDIRPGDHCLCQVYMSKPFLIDRFKLDLRIYVLITSCDPFRIFVFHDGLVRFATRRYTEPTNHNLDDICMHLTNYAINKHSKDFVRDDEEHGSKRRLTTLNTWFDHNGYDKSKVWANIDDVIIKTLISAHPVLKHNYRSCFSNHYRGSACFEILGFDIMLLKNLKPILVEVNLSPSFHTDSLLDKEVKEALLYDALNMLNFNQADKRKCLEEDKKRIKDRLLHRVKPKEDRKEEERQTREAGLKLLESYEDEHMGGYRRIYPTPGCEKYDKYFEHSGTLFAETVSSKARGEMARQMREELKQKQEKLDGIKKGVPKRYDSMSLRPESPRNPADPTRRMAFTRPNSSFRRNLISTRLEKKLPNAFDAEDTATPLNIVEHEELERISGLLQRDALVRGSGIVELVHRMLYNSAGTSNAKAELAQQQMVAYNLPFTFAPVAQAALQSSITNDAMTRLQTHVHLNHALKGLPNNRVPGYATTTGVSLGRQRTIPPKLPYHTGTNQKMFSNAPMVNLAQQFNNLQEQLNFSDGHSNNQFSIDKKIYSPQIKRDAVKLKSSQNGRTTTPPNMTLISGAATLLPRSDQPSTMLFTAKGLHANNDPLRCYKQAGIKGASLPMRLRTSNQMMPA